MIESLSHLIRAATLDAILTGSGPPLPLPPVYRLTLKRAG
jgi:hypothetical protein